MDHYTPYKLQNVSPWDKTQPTISIEIGSQEWLEAFKNWKLGKNPTGSKEWKLGVYLLFKSI